MEKRLERNFGLDVFRAVAICFVVSNHGAFLIGNTFLSGFPYINKVDGVDLFFVLSGFLIGGILLKQITNLPQFNFSALLKFWKRRWLRTLPNYYLVLGLNVLVVYFNIINEDFQQFNWKFFFFLQNFTSPFSGFFWESWSLSVEEWFYLISPLAIFLLLKKAKAKHAYLAVTIAMIVGPLLHRVGSFNPGIDDFMYDIAYRKMVFTRLDSIAYGLLAAWLFYYYPLFWNKIKAFGLGLGAVLFYFIITFSANSFSFYMQVWYLSLSPIAAMCLLPYVTTLKSPHRFITQGVTHVSKISYSMYLLNFALVAEVIRDHFMPTSSTSAVITYFIYWLIVLVAATLLYTYFEKPIMDRREKE